MRLHLLASLVAAALLAGCAGVDKPAPIDDRTGTMASVPDASEPTEVAKPESEPAQTKALDEASAPVHYRPRTEPVDSGRLHVVAQGETLYKVGLRYELNPSDIARLNRITDPTTIAAGRALRLPVGGKVTAVAPAAEVPATNEAKASAQTVVEPAPTVATDVAAVEPSAKPSGVRHEVARRPDTPEQIAQKKLQEQQLKREQAARGEIRMPWPVKGEVIATFDQTQMGIDIAGNKGDPIRCVLDGTVQYVGNNTKGYGRFLIVRHNVRLPGKGSMPLITVYGNTSKVLVRVNERVRAGQVIARMGDTEANRVKLRFELRQGKPVDPIPYLEH